MIQGETYTVHIGSNLDILPTLPDNSVDSIVTDPPYGLSDNKFVADTITRWINGERDFIPDGKGFMGKSWDAFVPPPALWDECLRVLKPGGHLLAFFGSRTQDIGALSIRLAGFEIRDSIAWMYGSGFPKSLDISKAIDKAAGAEREKIQHKARPATSGTMSGSSDSRPWIEKSRETGFHEVDGPEPITPEAQQWEGWGTALKPAHEPIVVARKPLIGTVAENVLEHGTGGLNIDGSRIVAVDQKELEKNWDRNQSIAAQEGRNSMLGGLNTIDLSGYKAQGRWPANVILDPYTAELLDEQSGVTKSSGHKRIAQKNYSLSMENPLGAYVGFGITDSGGASRFFYVAKASKRDRNEGLEELPLRKSDQRSDVAAGLWAEMEAPKQNFHPTVKPTDLMRYLVKLVTPRGGVVLDPFTGSGSTGKAAILEGFRFIGCELTEDYIPIIEGRLAHAEKTKNEEPKGLF